MMDDNASTSVDWARIEYVMRDAEVAATAAIEASDLGPSMSVEEIRQRLDELRRRAT